MAVLVDARLGLLGLSEPGCCRADGDAAELQWLVVALGGSQWFAVEVPNANAGGLFLLV